MLLTRRALLTAASLTPLALSVDPLGQTLGRHLTRVVPLPEGMGRRLRASDRDGVVFVVPETGADRLGDALAQWLSSPVTARRALMLHCAVYGALPQRALGVGPLLEAVGLERGPERRLRRRVHRPDGGVPVNRVGPVRASTAGTGRPDHGTVVPKRLGDIRRRRMFNVQEDRRGPRCSDIRPVVRVADERRNLHSLRGEDPGQFQSHFAVAANDCDSRHGPILSHAPRSRTR